ncbi:TetR/AcrR family transcriptional regulator [Dyella silvatica]|uniref:TetR/AcrR family transcriptional regulator n=1 Tax=Dyella silvatica TaxID=2992128 RepID=UPI002258398C|nr:TetR/AcrR family transcriptional regulator [Dyella silvatica]
MAQRLKESVRQSILLAAAEAFARNGYRGTRLQDVAGAADIATGNLYRYYADKDALFNAIVSRSLAAQLLCRLRARVRELGAVSDWGTMTAGRSGTADALLDFFIEHRIPTLILLSGAEASPLAHVRPLVVRELTRLASAYLHKHHAQPDEVVPHTVLVQIFVGTADMIVSILQEANDGDSVRQAFAAYWRYQLAGLQALLHV